ncbi:MAG: hypothetical protein ABJG78_21190 [Cyclobacteriaceae bacterium]
MSYKPDEATLTSYLYDELSKEEHEKVKAYLAANSEAKKELMEIQSMREFMGKLEDKEVVEPSFVFDNSPTVVVSRGESSNYFIRSTIAVAASLSLLILIGYFTQLRISTDDNGLLMSFGNSDFEETNTSLSEESIKGWMKETLAANNEDLLGKIGEVESSFDAKTKQLQAANSSAKQLVNYKIDQDIIDKYVSQITQENRDILLNLMEVSGRSQKQYMDDMMQDFAKFMESQRQNDLEVIQGHLNIFANNQEVNSVNDYRNSE